MSRRLVLPTLLVALSACSQSSLSNRPPDDGFDGKPWEIQQAHLPAYPKQRN